MDAVKEGCAVELLVPEYYVNFQCIADRCRHTCCQGWEMDAEELERQISGFEPNETADFA